MKEMLLKNACQMARNAWLEKPSTMRILFHDGALDILLQGYVWESHYDEYEGNCRVVMNGEVLFEEDSHNGWAGFKRVQNGRFATMEEAIEFIVDAINS